MPTLNALLDAVNNKSLPQPDKKSCWVEASDRISVHAKGIRPKFESTRKRNSSSNRTNISAGVVTPANYEKRYQYLFDDYILNRHPNENPEHYNWRLSTFPLISQEIYLNAKEQIIGAIFQQNQYGVKANDPGDQEYLDSIQFIDFIKDKAPEEIFTDPNCLFVVVEGHFGEFDSTEIANPIIEIAESRHIMYYKPREAVVFEGREKHEGKKIIYFVDINWCVKLIETKNGNRNSFEVLSYYEHGFGELPVVENNTNFFQKYVSWADMLARNISDDEVIAKNASYPIRQVVEPVCPTCLGSKVVPVPCKDDSGMTEGCTDQCGQCGGRGTISINPGDTFVVPERDRNDSRPIEDYVKYINPDISINDFSYKRWKEIYDFGMRSMHMRYTEEAQSGVAKAIDREQLYLLITNVRNTIYRIAEKLLRYIIAYRTVLPIDGIEQNKSKEYTIHLPTQFQIKTEYDLQQEYTDLITKGADITVRLAKLNEYMYKVYQGDTLALKKYEAIKSFDWLFGMTDSELNTRKILGSAQINDFIRHDRATFILNKLILEKGPSWVIEMPTQTVVEAMENSIKEYLVVKTDALPDAKLI